jgi:hypothetical protein
LTTWGARFRIFTIGVGATPGFRDLLRKVAETNDYYAQADVATTADLDQFFTMTIPAALRTCSPRLLDYRRKTTNSPERISERFKLNRFTNELTIVLKTNFGLDDDFMLKKDSVFIQADRVDFDGNHLMLHLDFPKRVGDRYIDEMGEWELIFSASKGQYEIYAMAEDKNLKASLKTGNQDLYFPGQTIPVSVNLTHDAMPITGATVKGILLKPGQDLGDLASEANAVLPTTGFEQGTQIGQRKIDQLIKDPAFAAKLARNGSIVDFSDTGNGLYRYDFGNNRVTGTYQVIVWFDGNKPGIGNYEGWESKCILVDFAPASDIELNAVLRCAKYSPDITSTVVSTSSNCTLIISPTNRVGSKLGPGQLNRIKLQSPTATFGELKDNLDGTYSSTVTYSGANPQISVYVVDGSRPVYEGSLTGLIDRKRWGISAHVGASIPLPGLDSLYQNGYSIGLDMSYKIKPLQWIELLAAYNSFSPDFSIINANLSYKLLKQMSPAVTGGLAIGLGGYFPKNQNVTGGVSARASLAWKPNPRVMIGIDGAAHFLSGSNLNFATAGIAAHYFF